MAVGAYRASGLASNLDTQGIIDKLVQIESKPLTDIAAKKATMAIQISGIGSLMSQLDTLSGTALGLKSSGITSITASGSYTDFTVSGSATNTGRYTVKVDSLARAAKARSAGFANGDAEVSAVATSLQLSIDGTAHTFNIAAGTKLKDLVTQINGANKPVTASLVSDGSQTYLTLTSKNLGYRIGQAPADALTITSDPGLGLATPPELEATNAKIWLDGLAIDRRSNELADVISGATINLKAATQTNAEVVFNTDMSASTANLQRFVGAYNTVASFLEANIAAPVGTTNTGDRIDGSQALNLQRRLHKLISTEVNTTGAIRTLRDLGIALQKDGTIKLDSSKLQTAINKDPVAVNTIFTKATTGIGDSIGALVKSQNDAVKGALTTRKASIRSQSEKLDDQTARVNRHLELYRAQLERQFTALENLMAGVNSTATFLDQQTAQWNKK